MIKLLTDILGNQKIKVLEPLLKNESLASYIFTKILVNYLKLNDNGKVNLTLFNNLNKSMEGYSGDINLKDLLYSFNNLNEIQIAALVSVALDKSIDCNLKALDLAKLAKSIDLLLKSDKQNKPETKQNVARPTPPKKEEILPPIPSNTASNSVANIKQRALRKTLLVSNKESKTLCKICGKAQFNKTEFTGCDCLKGLAKSIECNSNAHGFLLKFDNPDLLLTIAESVGKC
jgi:hypothetical protein